MIGIQITINRIFLSYSPPYSINIISNHEFNTSSDIFSAKCSFLMKQRKHLSIRLRIETMTAKLTPNIPEENAHLA